MVEFLGYLADVIDDPEIPIIVMLYPVEVVLEAEDLLEMDVHVDEIPIEYDHVVGVARILHVLLQVLLYLFHVQFLRSLSEFSNEL